MNRREFFGRTAAVAGAALGAEMFRGRPAMAAPAATQPAAGSVMKANDTILLPGTGIKTSRLSIGTGYEGGATSRRVGEKGMVKLFRHGLDEGVRWWDTADMYKNHHFVAAALKEIKRDQVVITSKTSAKTAEGVKADIERFRKEMDCDYIDIVLLHCMEDPKWPQKMRGAMDALSEAKAKGHVRALGCSCHTFGALQAAADEPWVEVDLARINPFARVMDVDKAEQVQKVEATLKLMRERGKAVYGMKILGAGTLKGDEIDQSLKFAMTRDYLTGFTIGINQQDHLDDLVKRIERLGVRA